jgi:hypothetical protein
LKLFSSTCSDSTNGCGNDCGDGDDDGVDENGDDENGIPEMSASAAAGDDCGANAEDDAPSAATETERGEVDGSIVSIYYYYYDDDLPTSFSPVCAISLF